MLTDMGLETAGRVNDTNYFSFLWLLDSRKMRQRQSVLVVLTSQA